MPLLPQHSLVVLVLLLGLGQADSLARADEAAWAALQAARTSLEAAPTSAGFVQTYTPAGFTTGDSEDGRLHLSLPECVRWDYAEPYPRSYLLCGRIVWSWNPGEPVGDRYLSVSVDEAGLDFLLLSVERLRQRYDARLVATEQGEAQVELTSLSPEAPFERATILLDAASNLPSRLEYTDIEGSTTRFDLSRYGDSDGADLFVPPEDIEWIDG